jgi:lipopolysaccharide export LptBFGC system permease protein LptF
MNSDKYKIKLFFNKIGFFLAKNFFIFILGLFFLILIFGFFLFLKPKINDINEKRINLILKETEEYPEKLKEFRKISDYIKIYNEIDVKDIKKIEAMLKNQDSKEEFFAKIEHIFTKNGLIIDSITIDKEAEKTESKKKEEEILGKKDENERVLPAGIGKYNIRVDITGVDYRGLKNILNVLENDISIIDVEDIIFSPDKETLGLKLSTYYKQ